MLSSKYHREIVSGRRRGLRASLWRLFLRLCEVPYGIAVRWRNRRFDRGKRQIHRVGVPVICVGNITTGGTGKTPMVAWLARWFRERDVRVALVSRGYGAQQGAVNDEALELERQLPDVPHLQNADRVDAAQTAIEECESQLILLDDGYQHRRLHRDLDIVLIDALEPFGYGHMLPRGLLREPLKGLARAQFVALSRADAVAPERREEIRAEVNRFAPSATWIELAHQPRCLVSSSGAETPIEQFTDRPIAAFCGIGNPDGFMQTLQACEFQVAKFREFPDHHAYSRADIESLTAWARDSDAATVICTDKDLVKIALDQLGDAPLFSLAIRIEIVKGKPELEENLTMLQGNRFSD